MSHINYVRRIHQVAHIRLDEYFTSDVNSGNFSVFCGDSVSRNMAAIRGLTRACGKKGVVIIHNDTALEDRLGLIRTLCTGQYSIFSVNGQGQRQYDPLYGLEETDILDLIIPFETAGAAAPQLVQARACLSDYLRIMRWQYQQGNPSMHQSPYNLDLLISLASMSAMDLENRVLAYMPDQIKHELSSRMSRQGVQQSVWYMISNFASKMSAYFWTRQENWKRHSTLSIVSAVQNGDVISVRIPDSEHELLRCCSIELQSLLRREIPFLVLFVNIRIIGNSTIENIIFNPTNKCAFGLVSPTVNTSIGNDRIGDVLNTSNQVVVLPCGSIEDATVFSNAMGSYYRIIRPIDRSRERRAFHIIPTLTRHRGYQETETHNIRPEELLNGSCLLCGADDDAPYLVKSLDL